MSTTLHRAVATSRSLNATVHVFFECDIWLGAAKTQLVATLARLWSVRPDDIAVCNLRTEREVIEQAVGLPHTGYARLLEVPNYLGSVIYIDPRSTLMLVTPKTLRRLLDARDRVASLAATAQVQAWG